MLIAFIICVASVFSAHAVNVIYNLNGGILPNGNTDYSVESGQNTVVLENPTKTGFIFTGWCDSEHYSSVNDKDTCSTDRVGLKTITNGNASKTIVRWTVPDNLTTDTTYIAMWEEDKFQIGITGIVANDSDNNYFAFQISARGNFWIDWGDGTVEYTAGRTNDNMMSALVYSHTYTDTDTNSYTVRFGGLATQYAYNLSTAAIKFGSANNESSLKDWTDTSVNENLSVSSAYSKLKVNTISGSLGAIFPTLGNTVGLTYWWELPSVQPMFSGLFGGCTNLTSSISPTLFSGISGVPMERMFYETFSGCSGLTGSIPANLFGGLSGAPAVGMFAYTFNGCSSLTGQIPTTLFGGISGTSMDEIFKRTFAGCSGLGRDALEDDPSTKDMVENAPKYSIPANLFGGISGAPAIRTFYETFSGCSGLIGTIPATLISYSVATDTNYAASDSMFSGSGLSDYCPSGMDIYYTNSYKVSCIARGDIVCEANTSLSGTNCVACSGNDCPTVRTLVSCSQGYSANATHDECVSLYNINYELNGAAWGDDEPADFYVPGIGYSSCMMPNLAPGYFWNGWRDENNNWSYCIDISAQDTGDKTFYAQFSLVTLYCDAGQYAYVNGSGVWCEACPDGYYCPGGSDLSVNNQGLYLCSPGAHPACECDLANNYHYDYAQNICRSCSEGYTWGSNYGRGDCVCNEGYKCCGAGEYMEYHSDKNDYSCEKCEPGTWCPGVAWKTTNTWVAPVDMINQCDINTSNPEYGMGDISACVSCGDHGHTNDTGASECICDAGYAYDYKGKTCVSTDCPYGYTWDSKEGTCICDKGFVCCDAGEYFKYVDKGSIESNYHTCDKCDSGYYCEGGARKESELPGGDVGQEQCPSGSTSEYNSSVCICDSGEWDTVNHECTTGGASCDSGVELIIVDAPMCLLDTEPEEGIMSVIAYKRDSTDNTKINTYYIPLTTTPTEVHSGSGHQLVIKTYNGSTAVSYYAHDASVTVSE